MSKPSRLEKMVFVGTLGVVPFSVLITVVGEGEQNGLDGTCQLNMRPYLLGAMAGLDASLSLLYLYLFIQPLRETIAVNEAALNHPGATAQQQTSTPATTKRRLASTTAPPATLHTALEKVMRANTSVCVASGERNRGQSER